jgi:nucleoside-diphosphate-sugar epimerase
MVRPDVGRIVALGSAGGFESLVARLEAQVREHGLAYLGAAESGISGLMARVEGRHMRLDEPGAGLAAGTLEALGPIDAFVHIAGLTTFKQDARSAAACQAVNVEGTRALLAACAGADIRRFVHVGSAYSAGRIHGVVAPDEQIEDGAFHNPYQRSKAVGEGLVRSWGRQTGTPVVVVRPTTIGGRLLTAPRGHVTKFDVYLGWAKSMLRLKGMYCGGLRACLDAPLDLPFRLCIHSSAGLNIVPVDRAARMLAVATLADALEHGAYHISNPTSTPHHVYVRQMLDALQFRGVEFVSVRPSDPTPAEQFYYDRLGWVFADYVENPELIFDRSSQTELEGLLGEPCPAVDAEAFAALLAYAHERHYGLNLDREEKIYH